MAFVGVPPFSHLRCACVCEQGAEILPSLVNLLFRLFLGREKDPTVLAQLWTGASLLPFCALSLHSLLHSPSPDHTAPGEKKESFRALHNGFPIVGVAAAEAAASHNGQIMWRSLPAKENGGW